MKTKISTALLCCFILFSSCKKGGITFSLSNQTNLKVESATPINLPFEIATPDVSTNSSQEFQNNRTAGNLIKEVTLDELKLSITNPANKTFSFLKSIQIFISTDGSDEVELASLDNVSSTTQTIILTPAQQNLLKYVKASTYRLRTKVVTKETLTQAVDIKATIRFKIKASLL